jgi:hypothetical protein
MVRPDSGGTAMTAQRAQEIGTAAARECFRHWDKLDSPYDHVWRHLSSLDARLRAEGLTDDDDDLYGAAGSAFRSEAECLFGADYVVEG